MKAMAEQRDIRGLDKACNDSPLGTLTLAIVDALRQVIKRTVFRCPVGGQILANCALGAHNGCALRRPRLAVLEVAWPKRSPVQHVMAPSRRGRWPVPIVV